ncbi:MAG: peptidyl-prolyl cis-trans isomerase [Alphaproteobacteria bacterium]|nr:peptidyl-prolyl cis-trans isomerase [Alphaproteobacteria bacterium]
MIQFFIKIANNWVGKVIFGILLFGMCFVLGYGGLSNTSRYAGDAVTVGGRRLSMKGLDEAFRREVNQLSKMVPGQQISYKQAIEMGLLENVVRQKANEMILDEVKDQLGLTASNAAVQKYVERHPAFADATGHFDRLLFLAYLRQMNMNEREMGRQLQNELATQHLTRVFQGLAYAPTELVKNVYRHQNEKRDVTALLVEPAKIKSDRQPTEDELKTYYDVYASEQFVTPEYRSFSYLLLTPDVVAKRIPVTEEEISAVYLNRKTQFETPEKRAVSQMFFADEVSAKAALSGLTADNFEKVASDKLGQTADVTRFGYVEKNGLMDELSDPVFQAKKGQIIGPVQSMTGWHILLVTDIQAAHSAPEKEVRSKIKEQLVQEKSYDVLNDLIRQVEDSLGEGKSLTQTAKDLNLTLKSVDAIDIAGIRKNGKELTGDVANRDLIQNLFTLKIGESTPLFDNQNGVIVAELTDIIPVGVKSYDSVRTDLMKQWTLNRQKEMLPSVVEQIVERAKKGNGLLSQATFGPYVSVHEKELKQTDLDKFPASVLQGIFKQKEGSANITTFEAQNGTYIVIINKVKIPDMTKDRAGFDKARESLLGVNASELTANVIASYADKFGVKINEKEIKKAFDIDSEK